MKMPGAKMLAAGAAVLIAGWYFWGGGHGGDDAGKQASIPITTAPVEMRDVPLELQNVGTVVPYETVAVRSRIDSQLMEVKFHDGDEVNAGDLLFVLDDRTLKAQEAQMEANLAHDRAQLENLRQQFERQKELKKQEFASQADFDTAKAAYDAQQGSVDASIAAIENIKVQIGYTRIIAPISGRTGTINVTVGNTVKANDVPLVTINQIKPIRAQVSLPQQYLDTLRDAMGRGTLQVGAMREGGGDASLGELQYIDNAVDQSTGTFAARASFANEDEKLWPGMFVTIRLTLGEEKHVPTVPEVAVQHGQSGDFVFAVVEGKAVKKTVKVLRMQDDVAVLGKESAVKEGDLVAVDGLMSLRDGSAVKAQAAAARPAAPPAEKTEKEALQLPDKTVPAKP
jgi:multidrug efflux system membrane fusion protein